MKTIPWWVCSCGTPINRVGKTRNGAWENHLKTCPIKAANDQPGATYASLGMHIKQLPE